MWGASELHGLKERAFRTMFSANTPARLRHFAQSIWERINLLNLTRTGYRGYEHLSPAKELRNWLDYVAKETEIQAANDPA